MGKISTTIQIYRDRGIVAATRQVGRFVLLRLLELLNPSKASESSKDPYHINFQSFINQVNSAENPGKILEIGSRNVTGVLNKHNFSVYEAYVGFDILDGENVDVVGDVHRLSDHFANEEFDFVYSISVFEHLAMPWKAILEINRVMKTGGSLFISTHPTWPPHELPWDFWRFNEGAFKVLLNPLTGFELVSCCEGLPCSIVPHMTEPSMAGLWRHDAYLGISVIAKKVGDPDSRLTWNAELNEMLDSMYPGKD